MTRNQYRIVCALCASLCSGLMLGASTARADITMDNSLGPVYRNFGNGSPASPYHGGMVADGGLNTYDYLAADRWFVVLTLPVETTSGVSTFSFVEELTGTSNTDTHIARTYSMTSFNPVLPAGSLSLSLDYQIDPLTDIITTTGNVQITTDFSSYGLQPVTLQVLNFFDYNRADGVDVSGLNVNGTTNQIDFLDDSLDQNIWRQAELGTSTLSGDRIDLTSFGNIDVNNFAAGGGVNGGSGDRNGAFQWNYDFSGINGGSATFQTQMFAPFTAVPEPTSAVILGAIGGLIGLRRRRK